MFAALIAAFWRPQVLIHGRYSLWMRALGPGAAIWPRIGNYEVGRSYRLGVLPSWRRRIVIPMLARSIGSMPRPAWALIPSREAVAICSDKALFARYAVLKGLGDLIPQTCGADGKVHFPAVLKRTDLFGTRGIAIVHDADALAARLTEPDWAGKPVIVQEYISGTTEETLHVVCVGGRIVWHLAHSHQLAADNALRPVPELTQPRHSQVSPADLAVFERFFVPLGYEGPACIDFKRRPDGRIAVLEINPRFGSSLMLPEFTVDRAQAVAAILAHARWHGAGEDNFTTLAQ